MIAVMGVMAASSLFVAAAFAAVNGDLPLTRDSQDRKQSYAAAEAGINLYQYHLNQDPDYWTKCTTVPAPNGTELQPVNLAWDGVTPSADPRRWRNVAGRPTQYTIELLPAPGKAKCVVGDIASMLNPATGTFRIRSTGRPRANSDLKRSVIASFRRKSFLDFLYFTDFETTDPVNYSATNQSWAETNCGSGKYRPQRSTSCTEIQFADADAIAGPFHSNDSILSCGTPEFGRTTTADKIEFTQPTPAWKELGYPCPAGPPKFNTPPRTGAAKLTMPTTNLSLETLGAAPEGKLYTGKTTIRFNTSNMLVTNAAGTTTTENFPANGVIYVKSGTGGCGTLRPPSDADYLEPPSCGNVYLSGTYGKSLTVAAANDIIVRPTGTSTTNGDVIGSGDSVLGLIATNFVRVYHPCSGTVMPTVQIDAAILSLLHSFTVDNYDCGSKLGLLTVKGAIAQKYRGAVGTGGSSSGGTGYIKDYRYDDRLQYRSPPFFLDPIAASWHVIRSNEQVPPR
jgi:hypothetical protein